MNDLKVFFTNLIVNFPKSFWRYARNYQEAKQKYRELERAKKIALKRQSTDNRTYYVLRDWEDKLHALNRNEVKALQNMGIFSKKIDIHILLKAAEYITPSSNTKK